MPRFDIRDCGANIGIWSLIALENIKEEEVFSFEPNPKLFKRLMNNLVYQCSQKMYLLSVGFIIKIKFCIFVFDENHHQMGFCTTSKKK